MYSMVDQMNVETVAEYEAALGELERLWETAKPGTPEGQRFNVLAAAVDRYERENFRIRPE